MKIIAFANQKGGVGKTTSCITLGHKLALDGMRTLLVDLDPQGHIAIGLGLKKLPGLYELICLDKPIQKVIVHARPNLDVLPSDKHTEKVKRQITVSDFRESVLADLLRKTDYDVILIDMAPSLDVLHVNGLIASDWVVIPTRLDALAVDGVKEILFTMGEITQRGHPIQGYFILPTFFDRVTRETLTQFRELIRVFGGHVLAPIAQDTRAREAPAYGKTLLEYSPSSVSVRGILAGDKRVGGYLQFAEKIKEVLNG
jgi:chromosome partitioning protein